MSAKRLDQLSRHTLGRRWVERGNLLRDLQRRRRYLRKIIATNGPPSVSELQILQRLDARIPTVQIEVNELRSALVVID